MSDINAVGIRPVDTTPTQTTEAPARADHVDPAARETLTAVMAHEAPERAGASDILSTAEAAPAPSADEPRGSLRPLSGGAADFADRAQAIASGEGDLDDRLEALQALRNEAVEAGSAHSGIAAEHIDLTARRMLTGPLGEAVSRLPGMNEAVSNMAEEIFSRCASAKGTDELNQASSELKALKLLLDEQGLMTPEARESFSTIETMITNRQGVEGLLQIARSEADAAAGPTSTNIREAFGLAAEVERQSSAGATDRPAFAHLMTGGVAREARAVEAQLAEISAARAEPVKTMLSSMEALALEESPDFDSLRAQAGDLDGLIDVKAQRLLAHDETSLREGAAGITAGIDLAEHAVNAEKALQTSHSALELEAVRDEPVPAELSFVPDSIMARYENAVNRTDVRIHELHAEARNAETQFADVQADRLEAGEAYDEVHEALAARISGLMVPTAANNLSEVDREAAIAGLRALDQHGYMQEFDSLLDLASSPRLDAPSLTEAAERLAEMPLEEDVRGAAMERLVMKSGESLGELRAELADRSAALDGMTMDEIRDLPLDDWRGLSAERLTEADQASFAADLGALEERAAQALTAKAESMLGTSFSETDRPGVHAFLKATGWHPAAVKALGEPAFADRLGDLSALAGNGSSTPELDAMLDDLMVSHPSLDDGIRSCRLACAEDPAAAIARHDSLAVRRDVMGMMKSVYSPGTLGKLGVSGDVATPELLERLVAGADSSNLSRTDLSLVRALWTERSGEGMSFEAFAAGLPEGIRDLPGLEDLLATGLEGTSQMNAIGRDLRALSKGFGGRQELADVCARLATSDDRVALDKYLTTVMRNLVGARSITGMQALEGNASAARSALTQEKYGYDVVSDLVDAFRHLAGADDLVLASTDRQIEAVRAMAPALTDEIRALEAAKTQYALAETAVKKGAVRNEMLDVLERCRPHSENVRTLRDGGSAEVHGAQASLTMLMLDDILTNPDFTIEERRSLAEGLKFQKHLDIERMKGGHAVSRVAENAGEFRRLLSNFTSAPEPAAAEAAAGALRDYMAEKGLQEKALAVLYFKEGSSPSKVDSLTEKFASCIGKADPGAYEAVKLDLEKRIVDRIFVGRSDNATTALAREQQAESLKAIGEKVDECRAKLSKHLADTIDKVTNVSIAGAFLESGAYDSADDLIADRDAHQDSGDWAFEHAVLDQAEKLGFSRDMMEPFVRGAIDGLTSGTFRELADSVSRDPIPALRDMLLNVTTPKAMKALIAEGRFTAIAGDMLEVLHDKAKTLTLSTERKAGVTIPVLESGAAEVSAHLGAAVKNGLSVWKGDDERFHMTLMRTRGGEAGVSAGILEAISVNAGVTFDVGTGCDLEFADEARCAEFLGRMLAGVAGRDDLALCSGVRRATEVGIGASLEAGIEGDLPSIFEKDEEEKTESAAMDKSVGETQEQEEEDDGESWLSYSASASVSGSALWRTERNADGVTRTRTLTGTAELAANFTIAPEGVMSKMRTGADKLSDMGADFAGDAADAIESHNAFDAQASFEFIESRSVSTRLDGTLTGAEVVRTFHPKNAAAIEGLLAKSGISEATRRAVARDAEGMDEGYRIEVVSRMPGAEVDRVAAEGRKGVVDISRCRPAEVRLVGTTAEASAAKGLDTERLALSQTDAGAIETKRRYRA